MITKLRVIFLIVVGIISIILSVKCFTIQELSYESRSMYGGDAFTGIQNAASVTSRNVKELAEIEKFGFGAILLVGGLLSLGIGLTTPIKNKTKNNIVLSPNSEQKHLEEIPKSEEIVTE